ncbi:MAG: hypothetical protein WCL44_11850, partial [bacterium]
MDAEARKGRRSGEKENLWRALMQEHGGSGKSVRKFCEEKGLNENLFYGWRLRPAAPVLRLYRGPEAG